MIKWIIASAWVSWASFPGHEKQCVVTRTEAACHIVRGMEQARLFPQIFYEVGECIPVKMNYKLDKNCKKGDLK